MKHLSSTLVRFIIASGIILSFAACKKDDMPSTNPPQKGPDLNFFALDNGTKLLKYNASMPNNLMSSVNISGLGSGENILAIDFRPATGQLYGLGSTSRLYIIDLASGNARPLGSSAFTPALAASVAGFDFNPTVDRIRVVCSNGQNLRLNPETGTVVATDGPINGAAGTMISGVGYTNSVAGASSTVLFDIDPETDMLYKQDPPNDGSLIAIGKLNVDISGETGFDISPDNTSALLLNTRDNKTSLFLVNVSTGNATPIGELKGGTKILGIAIPTNPVAYAISGGTNMLIFDPTNLMPVSKAITGLQPSETIFGIDFRPANGQLYALGSSSRLYSINASSGAATAVSLSPLSKILIGTHFGFDFNPTVDRIRVTGNTGQNLRLNPNDGTVAAIDLDLNPGAPAVSASAYTNNFAGATTTTLFDIDYTTDKLYRQDPPNNGTLVEIGSLGINVESSNGFDIGGSSGSSWAIFTVGGVTKLYSINLSTGAATASGSYSFMGSINGFAVGLGF